MLCPRNPNGQDTPPVHSQLDLAFTSHHWQSKCNLRFPCSLISIFSSPGNPPEVCNWKRFLISLSNYLSNHHHLWAPSCRKKPWGELVQMVPYPRLSVVDQGNNCLAFAAKYSKKCWIYHLSTPKPYCFSKSISFSTLWFSGFPRFRKYFFIQGPLKTSL